MCVQYGHLNQMTINDANPQTRINELITSFYNPDCFLPLDLPRGYQPIPERDDARPKTSLIRPIRVQCDTAWAVQLASQLSTINGRHFSSPARKGAKGLPRGPSNVRPTPRGDVIYIGQK